jgi:DNA-binding NarL/FixJ family response regulator
VRVAVLNDFAVVADALAVALRPYADEVEVADRLLVDQPVGSPVDVAIYDTFGQPAIEGPVRWLCEQPEVARVAVLSASTDPGYVERATSAGATGFIAKSADTADLVRALRQVASGTAVRELGREAAGARRNLGWPGKAAGLSERESEISVLAADGHTNGEIAGALCIGRETVKTHLSSVYRKLGARNRVQVAAWVHHQADFQRRAGGSSG